MISVVIPLYNKERSIVSTIESVLSQTYKDWELIVINDGSTDNSLEVVKNFVEGLEIEERRLKILSKPNGGVCSARNRGIQEAKGEYVALLDGDDLWDKEYLAEQMKMIEDFPDAAMWGINFAEVADGKLVRKLATALSDGYRGYVENYFHMNGRVSDLFCSSSVVIKKTVFDEVGLFDERIKYSEDNDMWWRIIATHQVAFYDRYMVYYRFDAENRALRQEIQIKDSLPYYVDKYQQLCYRENKLFYTWVNRNCSQQTAQYYFHVPSQRMEAAEAARRLDYSVLPFKYRLYFKCPFWMGNIIYRIEKWIKSIIRR